MVGDPQRRAAPVARPAAGQLMLRVRVPPDRSAERRYIVELLLSEWLGLELRLEPGPPDATTIELVDDADGGAVVVPDVFLATPAERWLSESTLPELPLATVPAMRPSAAPTGATLPVLFGQSVGGDAWSQGAARIDLAIDVFGSAFFLLSRYEEVARPAADDHDRFPARASVAAAAGFLARPLVDEYVELLWGAMTTLWPSLERRPATFRLRLSHDVDQPWAVLGQPAAAVAHALAGDVLRRRDLALAARRARAILDARSGRVDRDPYDTFELLMATSERIGVRSTFYFLAGNEPGDHDFRYRIDDPHVLKLLGTVHDRGHEIGLHASYDSFRSADRIAHEFEALRRACRAAGVEQAEWGVRQHYLRFRAPETWRHHEAAGFAHDSTLGYADASGYRAGTSREFPLWDVVAGRPIAVRERPLIVMDATLLGYDALDLDAAAERAAAIVDESRRLSGDAVVLYHNSSLPTPALRRHYRNLVTRLAGTSGPARSR